MSSSSSATGLSRSDSLRNSSDRQLFVITPNYVVVRIPFLNFESCVYAMTEIKAFIAEGNCERIHQLEIAINHWRGAIDEKNKEVVGVLMDNLALLVEKCTQLRVLHYAFLSWDMSVPNGITVGSLQKIFSRIHVTVEDVKIEIRYGYPAEVAELIRLYLSRTRVSKFELQILGMTDAIVDAIVDWQDEEDCMLSDLELCDLYRGDRSGLGQDKVSLYHTIRFDKLERIALIDTNMSIKQACEVFDRLTTLPETSRLDKIDMQSVVKDAEMDSWLNNRRRNISSYRDKKEIKASRQDILDLLAKLCNVVEHARVSDIIIVDRVVTDMIIVLLKAALKNPRLFRLKLHAPVLKWDYITDYILSFISVNPQSALRIFEPSADDKQFKRPDDLIDRIDELLGRKRTRFWDTLDQL